MGDTWGVGSEFESMARSAHDAIGGTVCILANGVCAPLGRKDQRASISGCRPPS
jgi:hypothetical protein